MPSGFGKAYLGFSKTMDWFSYSEIPSEVNEIVASVNSTTASSIVGLVAFSSVNEAHVFEIPL